jgi:toxin ParE1/3/4
VRHASVSSEAQADIDDIASYTTNAWGWRQTDRYLDQLEESIDLLTRHPSIGRPCDSIDAGLHRFEVGKHVVFYRINPGRIRVVRVLHQQMLPTKPHFDQ